jgi:hypothetical protein
VFELYVILTNMYWLVSVLQIPQVRKLDKIILYLSAEERKILMEKLQKEESSEWKNSFQYDFFLIFINNILKNIR